MPYIRANGIRIAFDTFGSLRNKPLFLIHGLTGQRMSMEKLAEQLSDEFFVISENMLDDYNIDKLYRYNASAFSIGNDGYVTCGLKFTGEILRDTWRYTPDGGKGRWQMIGDFEGPSRHSATCFAVGRYGFLLCGQNGNFSESFKDDVWLFSPDEKYSRRTSR